ncbi:MAG: SPASM domain-containing protein [Chitinophagales bacterium]|nr:SPASM domain-containing protein [Chitinophagales bacterium]
MRDAFHFLNKLTPAKAGNAGRILSSYYRSRLSGNTEISGYPITLSIEPTTSCNLRCPECPSGLRSFTRDTGMLEMELFKKVLDETERHLLYLYLYFQGEPYLHPQFSELVKYASRKGIYTVTSTNAHYLDNDRARETVESGLSRIIISIDGITQESYAKYRIGGSLQKVLEGTKQLVHWKKKLQSATPHIIFQFVVFSHNESEIAEVHRLAKEYGVDEVKIKTAQVYDFEKGSELIPKEGKYARYHLTTSPNSIDSVMLSASEASHTSELRDSSLRKASAQNDEPKYQIKNELLNHCWKLWHSSVVTWDGKVVPCCFDKDAKYVMGDLKQQRFSEIWNGDAYRSFRTNLLKSREEIDICKNCTEGTKVWA